MPSGAMAGPHPHPATHEHTIALGGRVGEWAGQATHQTQAPPETLQGAAGGGRAYHAGMAGPPENAPDIPSPIMPGAAAFEAAMARLLAHEGGYVNDPDDPGGETRYGISKRSYPDIDIRNLSKAKATAIYRRDWWNRYGYGGIKDGRVAGKIFDLAVNMGASPAHKILQRAMRAAGVHVIDDGILGDKTLMAMWGVPGEVLLAAIRSEAAGRYRMLVALKPGRHKYLKGWLARAYE